MKTKTPVQHTTEKLDSFEKIPYPVSTQFSESCYHSTTGKIYVPLNDTNLENYGGLYSLTNKEWRLEFQFPKKTDVILGATIQNDIFVGCNTYDNSLLIYDIGKGQCKSIHLIGCPNDICFSPDNETEVFVVMNIDFDTYCGILMKVNIETDEITYLLGNLKECIYKKNVYSVSGISLKTQTQTLYIATLPEIYTFHIPTGNVETIVDIHSNRDCPFYDNITLYKDTVNIAVFAYQQRLQYGVYRNQFLLKNAVYCMSGCLGIGFFDRTNYGRTMSSKRIKFIRMTKDKIEYVAFDKKIPDFDNEITQITQIDTNKYILTNYKANFLVLANILC